MVLGSLLMGSRNRQVMSPTDAHLPLPLLPSILLLQLTVMTIFFLILLSTEGSFGNAITVSLLPSTTVLTRTSCLGQTVPIGGCKLHSEGSSPEFDTDLCQCLSLPYCHTGTCTFTLLLARFIFQTVSLNFSCIAACISCILSPLLILDFLPGSYRGVGQKRGSETPENISYFALRCAHTVPSAPGSFFLGFTPCSGQKFRTQSVDRSTPKLLRSFPAIHSIWSQHPNIMKRTLEVFVQLLTFVCLHGCHHGGFLSSFFIGQMCHGSGLPRLSLIALNA